jgi:hypothetical protein
MGFSVLGTIIAVITMLPSLTFFVFLPPVNKPHAPQKSGPLPLTVLERIGQAACLIVLIISRDYFNTRKWDIWLTLCIVCLLIYYGLWIRYVARGRDYALLWKPLLFIPVPMAVFPAAVFIFAAIWGQSVWLGIAAALFASGHIPISLQNFRQSVQSNTPDSNS